MLAPELAAQPADEDLQRVAVGVVVKAVQGVLQALARDGGAAQRMELLASEDGVYNCSAVGYCSEVCPKHVDPGNAVNVNKINAAKDYFLRFLSPKGGAQ